MTPFDLKQVSRDDHDFNSHCFQALCFYIEGTYIKQLILQILGQLSKHNAMELDAVDLFNLSKILGGFFYGM